MKKPILTPTGKGEIEKIYKTELGHIMVKVWYKKENLFINWRIEKLLDWKEKLNQYGICK